MSLIKKIQNETTKNFIFFFYRNVLIVIFLIKYLNPFGKKSTIKDVHIELSNICNLKCKWCASSINEMRKGQFFKKELMKKFLDNITLDKRFDKLRTIRLWGIGESLLNPEFLEVLTMIKNYKNKAHKKHSNFPEIMLTTNATLLNQNLSKKIVQIGALDEIRFSLDGGTKEKFEKIRVGAKWSKVYKNVKNFIKINRGKIRVKIDCVMETEIGKKDYFSKEWEELFKLVDYHAIRYPSEFDGNANIKITTRKEKSQKSWICFALMHSLFILANGNVSVCCLDWSGRGVVGDFNNEDLYTIYTSKKRKNMINNILLKKKHKVPLCRNCRFV
ncbi:MAG: SPASM domain-containing protein [Nanoarchaeota archaeon]|nr:SPASM domain-containing protein [Nanoarchaeota archaeon]MBU1028055.1 SPASM domain-containing protein [Nanoarchaeota archaeon]